MANALIYSSEAFYDAKLWQFCRKQVAKDALIWNVAGWMLKFCSVGSKVGGKSTLGTARTGSKLVLKPKSAEGSTPEKIA